MTAPSALKLVKPDTALTTLKVLVYGTPGVGKTWLAGTAEDDARSAPVLFCDVEAGVLTIRKRGAQLDVVRIESLEDLRLVHKELRSGKLPHRTVVIDSLTELHKVTLRDISSGKPIPSIQDWGVAAKKLEEIISYFRNLPINLVCTALEMDFKDEQTGGVSLRPSLPGKLSASVGGYFDVVGRLTGKATKGADGTIRVERQLQVQNHSNVTAKDRSDALGTSLANPTIPHMLDVILGPAPEKPATKKA
jgi:phage nucleotide-binding protein